MPIDIQRSSTHPFIKIDASWAEVASLCIDFEERDHGNKREKNVIVGGDEEPA